MDSLFRKYRRKGVLLDTNLLLGYLIGSLDPRYLKDCRATTRYFGPDDFPLLLEFLKQFGHIITTPHILTEVSNLTGKLQGPLRLECRRLLRMLIGKMSENTESSKDISLHEDFLRFGLTDTAILLVAPKRGLVLTDDAPLYDLLARGSVDVINFNHVRMGAWQ